MAISAITLKIRGALKILHSFFDNVEQNFVIKINSIFPRTFLPLYLFTRGVSISTKR